MFYMKKELEQLKQIKQQMSADKDITASALEETEGRCTRLQLAKCSLEGEIQRLQVSLMDKTNENQVARYVLRRTFL